MIPYELARTNDLLTYRAGLIIITQLMSSVGLSELVDIFEMIRRSVVCFALHHLRELDNPRLRSSRVKTILF